MSGGNDCSVVEETPTNAPEPTLDDDRRADDRAPTEVADDGRQRTEPLRVDIDPPRPAGSRNEAADRTLERVTRPDGNITAGPTPLADHRHRVVRLVAAEGCGIRSGKQLTDFGHDRLEHLGRGRASRDQRRHPPQRRLFLRETRDLVSALRVRECGGDKLGELRGTLRRFRRGFPGSAHPAAITPHIRSSTRIGAPTAHRTPSSRASAATGPGASSKLMQVGWPLR